METVLVSKGKIDTQLLRVKSESLKIDKIATVVEGSFISLRVSIASLGLDSVHIL